MDYTELRTFKWISVVAAIVTIIVSATPNEPGTRFVFLSVGGILFAVSIWLDLKRDRLWSLFSGTSRYFKSFPPESNNQVMAKVQQQYCYLGISFSSILPQFRSWYESKPPAGVKVQILLTDPQADEILEFQARYQLGLLQQNLKPDDRERVEAMVSGVKAAIQSTCSILSALRDSGSHIEVRFHREKLRKWMQQVDGQRLYVGILHKGENGLNAPVLVLRHKEDIWSLFDHYTEEWESLWESAAPLHKAARK